MSCLLCPSPVILDHSFPRDYEELVDVSNAIGALQEHIGEKKFKLVLTRVFNDLVDDFDWANGNVTSILSMIHSHLSRWLSQPGDDVILLDLEEIDSHTAHPLPEGIDDVGLVAFWQDELGKLLWKHGAVANCCIGIACDMAFSGNQKRIYHETCEDNRFPIVGPSDYSTLDDAYDWDIDKNVLRDANVSLADTVNNLYVLGAMKIISPKGGSSHKRVTFRGSRSWTLDHNDPIPRRYFGQLSKITGYPVLVIKHILINGEIPRKILKISL